MDALEPRRWAARIRNILSSHHYSQVDLAETLGVSAATVSRWLSEKSEPTPQAYVALGNLADAPDDLYFWERAGVQLKPVDGPPPQRFLASGEVSAGHFKKHAAERVSRVADEDQSIIVIPLLGVCAYADEIPPHDHVSLAQAKVEEFITAPSAWCPHPESLISMHVCGESMFPTMQNDSLVVIDLAANKREDLNHELVVASHRDLGFKVARMQRLSDCYVLVPANPSCMPMDITNPAKWKIVGKVLWWITRDNVTTSK